MDVPVIQIRHQSSRGFLDSCWSLVCNGILKKLDLILTAAVGEMNLPVRVRRCSEKKMVAFFHIISELPSEGMTQIQVSLKHLIKKILQGHALQF